MWRACNGGDGGACSTLEAVNQADLNDALAHIGQDSPDILGRLGGDPDIVFNGTEDFVNAKSVIETATLPPILNHPAYSSNLLRNPAAGQTECALLHREAVILLRQIKPTFVEQFLVRNLADGIVAYNLYNASEANWVQEAPAGNSDPTTGDFGAVLIRTS